MSSYTIRQFTAADVSIYRAIRLEALQTEPGFFGNSYATELAYANEQWLARITNPYGACFGLYHLNDLIGITAIIILDKDKAHTAYMTQSYIRPAHRGKGLSKLLYNARLQWAREQGIVRLLIGHRRSNISSMKANQKFGFRYTHSESRTWPDGITEDMLHYELLLTG